MSSKIATRGGPGRGKLPHALRHLRAGGRRHPLSGAWPRALRRAGSKGRITDQEAVAESIRAAVTDAERGAQVSVDAVTVGIGGMEVQGAQSRGLYEFGRPHEVDAGRSGLRRRTGLRRPPGARPHAAARAAAGFHAGWPRRIPHVRNKGVCSRLEANVHIVTAVVAGASGADCRRAPGAPGRGRNRVRADGRRLRLRASRKSARAGWRCSTSGCTRPTW